MEQRKQRGRKKRRRRENVIRGNLAEKKLEVEESLYAGISILF